MTTPRAEDLLNCSQAGDKGRLILDDLRAHFARFIKTTRTEDLDILPLWTAHTHFLGQLFTSPRLLLSSALPACGKTTTVEHLDATCADSQMMSNQPTTALLARLTYQRTILLDEADLGIASGKESDAFSMLNSGFRRSGKFVSLEQNSATGQWTPTTLPVFGAAAMAGINPKISDAFMSRSIIVHLSPDVDGETEVTDWAEISTTTEALRTRLAEWAQATRLDKPNLPDEVRNGRLGEVLGPLQAIADAAGGEWPERCRALGLRILADREDDRALNQENLPPHQEVLRDIYGLWHLIDPENMGFGATSEVLARLRKYSPATWGEAQMNGRPALTSQALGKMLAKHGIRSQQSTTGTRARGYAFSDLERAWRGLGLRTEEGDSMTDS